MLAIVTYVEDIRPGFWQFQKRILDNLDYTHGVDVHYFIARGDKERQLYSTAKDGQVENRCVQSLRQVILDIDRKSFVNVQPMHVFEHRGGCYLPDFAHPEEACYIFGPNHGEIEVKPEGMNVSIPMQVSSLYTSSAVAMTLYDRNFGKLSCL